jgi:peptidylprolyl isomerase
MAKFDNIEVKGGFGEQPDIKFLNKVPAEDLEVEVLKEGDGQVVKAGDTIECDYHGTVFDGNVFDSSFERGSSIEFPVGVGMLIQGWDQTIPGHKVGTRLLISVPPEYGYGANGTPDGSIGGHDTIVFVVDIIAVK